MFQKIGTSTKWVLSDSKGPYVMVPEDQTSEFQGPLVRESLESFKARNQPMKVN